MIERDVSLKYNFRFIAHNNADQSRVTLIMHTRTHESAFRVLDDIFSYPRFLPQIRDSICNGPALSPSEYYKRLFNVLTLHRRLCALYNVRSRFLAIKSDR